MAFDEGFNFRATVGFVTDPADTQFVDLTDEYPVTSNGVTFGWDADAPEIAERDRSTGVDARLAGLHQKTNNGQQKTFRVDLGSAVEHEIRVAVGDASFSQDNQYFQLKDNTTVIATVDDVGNTIPTAHWFDATGVDRNGSAAWVSDNAPVTHTFSSTTFFIVIAQPGSSSGNTVLGHLQLFESAVAPAYEQVSFRFRNDDGVLGELA